MKGFDPKFRDLPDYIIGVTHEIWESRGIETLNRYYAADIPVRTPMGVGIGNQAVIASTMATCHEFPDRQLYADDVIWSGDEEAGFLSSHRLLTTATHACDGQFGPATGRRFTVYAIADCAARDNAINDEWLVRDYGGIVRQLGQEPKAFAAGLIAAEGGPEAAAPAFTPEMDVEGPYTGRGNDDPRGARYAEALTRIMAADFAHVLDDYDRAAIGQFSGGLRAVGRDEIAAFWLGLRSAFPDASFQIEHQIGMEGGMRPPRAALRWSLNGTHSGWGAFGRPTG
ncbi:MAG: ester cyclase, partial [Planctomycetota bacterium]